MTSLGRGLWSASGSFAGGDRIEVGFRVHRRSLATPAEAVRKVLDNRKGYGDEDEAAEEEADAETDEVAGPADEAEPEA